MADAIRRVVAVHDGILTICTGSSRRSKVWKQKQVAWSDLVRRLGTTKRTSETQAQFMKASKVKQDEIKDVGGFVGGELEGGRRTALTAGNRQIITLDADYADENLWDLVEMFFGDHAICCYSTHKHTPDKPRLRLVIPLNRPVTPDEYQAISRKVAAEFGIDYFDDTTYQPHRLMYWPSTSADAEFFFRWQDGTWLNADSVLESYDDWQDQSTWPVSSRQSEIVERAIKKQEDPLTKKGLIGAFCRAYTIPEVIAEYLPDVYEMCAGKDDRYTFKAGSSSGGAVVYEGKFLYSFHSTDPCSNQLVNAFDLVRIHRFGDMDEGKTTQDITKMPSWESMMRLVGDDEKVRVLQMKERMKEARAEFDDLGDDEEGDIEAQDFAWTKKLKVSPKTGQVLATRANIRAILVNDPRTKGTLAWDDFSKRIAIVKRPAWRSEIGKDVYWNDGDDAELRYMMETYYGIESKQKIEDETLNVANRNAFHRVREYLQGIKWDGEKRMDTLFIDYLGAADTAYTRMAARKMLIAAVARVMQPGIKFDNMVVLQGRQGIGKSYLLKKLGRQWFSDSLTTVSGKEAYEQLRGCWIIEMAELAALKKSELEATKQFISKQVDTYRVAYGKRLSEFPRQCVFVGTTNEPTFLKDRTGNRRFWPVRVAINEPTKSLFSDDCDTDIDQIWGEALDAWNSGEGVWIGKEMEKQAQAVQEEHTEDNPLVGVIQEYLDRDLPKNWYDLDLATRRDFLRGNGFEIDMTDCFKRTRTCPVEIWCELMGGDLKRFTPFERKDIRDALAKLEGWEPNKTADGKAWFGKVFGRQRTAYVRKITDPDMVPFLHKKLTHKDETENETGT